MFSPRTRLAVAAIVYLLTFAGAIVLFKPLLFVSSLAIDSKLTGNTPSEWVEVDLGGAISPTFQLVDVSMPDEDSAWIIGRKYERVGEELIRTGKVYDLQWLNGAWEVADSYDFPYELKAVFAVSQDDVWVLGVRLDSDPYLGSGVILHKDADGWHEMVSPLPALPDASLESIEMSADGKEGWIGGSVQGENGCGLKNHSACYDALLLRYQGGRWIVDNSIQQAGEGSDARSFDFVTGAGYAAGSNALLRYDGNRNQWAREEFPPSSLPCGGIYYSCNMFSAIHAVNSQEAWVIGWRNITLGPEGNVRADSIILQRVKGRWQEYTLDAVVGKPPLYNHRIYFIDLSFGEDNYGVMVGSQIADPAQRVWPYISSNRNDSRWHYESAPFIEGGGIVAVSTVNSDYALAIGDVRDYKGAVLHSFILSKRAGIPAAPAP